MSIEEIKISHVSDGTFLSSSIWYLKSISFGKSTLTSRTNTGKEPLKSNPLVTKSKLTTLFFFKVPDKQNSGVWRTKLALSFSIRTTSIEFSGFLVLVKQ